MSLLTLLRSVRARTLIVISAAAVSWKALADRLHWAVKDSQEARLHYAARGVLEWEAKQEDDGQG